MTDSDNFTIDNTISPKWFHYEHNRVLRSTQVWTINHFDFYLAKKERKPDKEDDVDEYEPPRLESPNFSPNKRATFCLELYPNGDGETTREHCALYLSYSSIVKSQVVINPPIRVKYEISILDIAKTKVNTMETIKEFGLVREQSWGWNEYICHTYLKENSHRLLPENKLTLMCELEVLDETVRPINSIQSAICEERLSSDWLLKNQQRLLQSGKLFDVIIVTGTVNHQAHRAFLAAQSPVFAAMFEADTVERHEGRVIIEDVEPDVMTEFLHFLYTGKVNHLDQLADRLLVAADKYGVDRLKSVCEQTLIHSLSNTNVLQVLALANTHSAWTLKFKTFEFITKNLSNLLMIKDETLIDEYLEIYLQLLRK